MFLLSQIKIFLNKFICLYVCLFVLWPAVGVFAQQQIEDDINILLLYSWHKDMPWQRAFEKGLRYKLLERNLPVNFYIEYADSGRFPHQNNKKIFTEYLKEKYINKSIDVIISDSIPASVILETIAPFFPDTQMIAVQSPSLKKMNPQQKLWKIGVKHDFKGAILEMINLYHPQNIAVVVDVAGISGKKRLENFKKELKELDIQLPVHFLTGPSLADVIENTKNLPPKSAIFYLLFFNDGKGNRVVPYKAAQKITKTANAPVFSHWDTLLGSGILGGYMLSGEKVGLIAGDAIDFFIHKTKGTKNIEFHFDEQSLFESQYDWRELKRWGINKKRLPQNSKVLFYTPGLFETYPLEMALVFSLIGVLLLFSCVLTFEVRRRKKIAERLKQSENYLSAIFESSPDPIIVFDHQGTPVYVNLEFGKQFGWNNEDLQNWDFGFVVSEDKNKLNTLIQKVVKNNQTERTEVLGVTKDNISKNLIISISVIQGDSSRFKGLVFTLTDISQQKKLAVQLQQAQKMESIGRLAGGVAHDFNNMLSVIIGHAEIVLDEVNENDNLYSSVLEIQKASQRSATLVRQLLAFARKQTVAPEIINLNEITEGMLNMLQRLIGESVKLDWKPSEDLWLINIDPSQIDQIMANLCVNARDAINGVGHILIETQNVTIDSSYCSEKMEARPGDYVLISVTDDGCGMDKETAENIFEPFFTTKNVGKGTGLGLSTIYGIVKQNQGIINVYSEINQGTTFKIYLPRYSKSVGGIKKKKSTNIVTGGSETILVVEDEESILSMTLIALEKFGYNVIGACNPRQALEKLEKVPGNIDLLITDVVMPEMNGKDFSIIIKKLYPDARCLFMSGYTANIIADHGILDADVDFIHKPFSVKDLAVKVRAVLDL